VFKFVHLSASELSIAAANWPWRVCAKRYQSPAVWSKFFMMPTLGYSYCGCLLLSQNTMDVVKYSVRAPVDSAYFPLRHRVVINRISFHSNCFNFIRNSFLWYGCFVGIAEKRYGSFPWLVFL